MLSLLHRASLPKRCSAGNAVIFIASGIHICAVSITTDRGATTITRVRVLSRQGSASFLAVGNHVPAGDLTGLHQSRRFSRISAPLHMHRPSQHSLLSIRKSQEVFDERENGGHEEESMRPILEDRKKTSRLECEYRFEEGDLVI